MSAAIVVFAPDHSISRVIGPFETGQEAADHSATLAWGEPRMIVLMIAPTTPCFYTFAHTRAICGNPTCRES